jgi:hypothetical protein
MTHLMVGFLLEGPKTGPDVGKASPVGLLIVVLLLIGVFVLVWSMNRHLKKLPTSFDTEASAQETPADAPPADPTSEAERPAHESGS